jgi:hypothetical protein
MFLKRLLVPLCAIAAISVLGCGSSMTDDTDASSDSGSGMDATNPDASASDSGKDAGNEGAVDASIDMGADAQDDASSSDAGPDGDGGASDAGPPPDGSGMCTVNSGFGSGSMNGCSAGENWTCGNDTYEFECFCPGNGCLCKKNNKPVKQVVSPSGCPNCSFSAQTIAGLCGFPY